MAEEEVAVLVVDNGGGMCKAGFLPVTMHFALWTLQVAAEAASREQPELSIFGCRPCKVLPSPLAPSTTHGEETSTKPM